jgi:ketosteroid isomerase-like protein
MSGPLTAEAIVGRIQAAMGSADLASFADLLAPDVHWGAPDDPDQSCRNRDQVLAWYRRGRDAGVRARVTETTVFGDNIVVGLMVTGRPAPEGADQATQRWQVLTVGDEGVVEICGFDDRDEAVARAARPSDHH